jgi:hypothetical protein
MVFIRSNNKFKYQQQVSISFFLFYLDGRGSSMSVSPSERRFTKTQGQSLGPIICSAQCYPPCQFHWIKPDGTVVDGSNLKIPSLMKSDHGTFACHAGNGYGNNSTKNIVLTVNCKYYLINDSMLHVIKSPQQKLR